MTNSAFPIRDENDKFQKREWTADRVIEIARNPPFKITLEIDRAFATWLALRINENSSYDYTTPVEFRHLMAAFQAGATCEAGKRAANA